MDIECPFCSFHAFDTIYIVEHIDTYHPEDDHGSSDTEDISKRFTPEIYVEGDSRSYGSDTEVEYIQCECGENVQLSEFTNHLALHMSEEITSYANLPQDEEYRASSIQAISPLESTTATRSQLRASSNRRTTGKNADHSEQRKVPHSKKRSTRRGLVLSPSNTRPSIAKPRHGASRRLGVGWFIEFLAKRRLIILIDRRAGPICIRESNAPMASEATRIRREIRRRESNRQGRERHPG